MHRAPDPQIEKPADAPPREAPSPPDTPARRQDRSAPGPEKKGALFRALTKAGCDADAAYNADAEVESMAAENLVAQLGAQFQLGFIEIKQLCQENAERLAEQDRKLDALTEVVVGHDQKLEVLAIRLDAVKMELRLVWGGLGVLVTVLIAVFGILFTR